MQMSPKRTKYRKMQKGNNRGIAQRGSDVSFGDFAMQAVEPGRILVAVGDDDPQHAPSRDDRGAMATSGRGMHLVELLASSWGVDVGQSSKVVWFEATYPLGARNLRSIPG